LIPPGNLGAGSPLCLAPLARGCAASTLDGSARPSKNPPSRPPMPFHDAQQFHDAPQSASVA